MEYNFEGSQGPTFEKHFLPKDVYEGKPLDVSDIASVPVYKKPDEMQEKMVVHFELSTKSGKVRVPYFMTNKVTKGYGKYSSSKLFLFLERFGWLEELKSLKESKKLDDKNEAFVAWLRSKLPSAKAVRVLTKITNEEKGSEAQYATVSEILGDVEASPVAEELHL